MRTTLLFDVYGTLVDTAGVAAALREDAGEAAGLLAAQWRDKQVEYAYRRGLMRHYAPFRVCVEQALRFVFEQNGLPLTPARASALMQGFNALPAFTEAPAALAALSDQFRVFAFSNGLKSDVSALLAHAGLSSYFIDVISVDDLRSFKPDPAVYAHARRASSAWHAPCWLVSSNAWDVIGARAAGLSAAWIRRSKERIYDPWDIEPNLVLSSLLELPERLVA